MVNTKRPKDPFAKLANSPTDQQLFTPSSPTPKTVPKSKRRTKKSRSHDITTSSNQDVKKSRGRDVKKGKPAGLANDSDGLYTVADEKEKSEERDELFNEVVRDFLKTVTPREPQMLRLIQEEKAKLDAVVYSLKVNGYQTTANDVLRIAVLYLCADDEGVVDKFVQRILKRAGKYRKK